MKKLVFVMPKVFGGGAERVVAALVEEISRMNEYEVHIITYFYEPEKEYFNDSRIIRHTMENKSECTIWRIGQKFHFLRNTIREIDPDCVLSLAGPAMITILAAAMQGLKKPLILSERNDPRHYPEEKHLRLLRDWAYRRSSAMVFQTHEAMEYFPHKIQKKGTVISNPLTVHLPEPYNGIRELRIVTSCRLVPQKNLDLLIDAFSDITEAFPQYTLDIYGEGPERDRLTAKIQEMQLENKVTLHGYSNQIYTDIRKAALFVSSSDYEGISNSMLEAVALGIPTVCTDCPAGGARETISHGQNGLLVPVGDRAALAAAMQQLLSDRELSDRLGQAGVALREKISIAAVTQQWLAVIEKSMAQSIKD